MSCYLVQEIDGTSRFTLEDDSGFLVLEDCVPSVSTQAMGDRRLRHEIIRRQQIDEDEIIAVLLSRL